MLPWSNPSEPQRFAVGDTVYSEPYADVTGTVVANFGGTDFPRVAVVWNDGNGGAIVYPAEATFLKKVEKLPWQ